jgi:hypothetical protein
MNEYIVSVDIAKRQDFFGILVMKDAAEIVKGNDLLGTSDRIIHYYDIVSIEKYQGMDYEDMAVRITAIMGHTALRNNADLIVDGTGVGEPAVELIRRKGCNPIPIIFTGGEHYAEVYSPIGSVFRNIPGQLAGAQILKELRIPKKDLVSAGTLLVQQRRVGVAPSRWKEEMTRQLMAFKGKVNEKTRNVKYEAENESVHDDLVVCYLMGAWWVLHRNEKDTIPEKTLHNAVLSWEPLEYM